MHNPVVLKPAVEEKSRIMSGGSTTGIQVLVHW